MPVYNAARYLETAARSILAQTFTDFEFLIFDDGSTDGSLEILRRLAAGDSRIQLIESAHLGYVAHLIEGCRRARGAFLARMDADDVSLPQRFARQVEYLRAHPGCVLVGARVLLIDPAGRPIRTWATESSHDQIDRAHLARAWPMVHPAILMRRAAFQQVGGYRKEYETLEDLDLFLRLAEIGGLANCPEVLLHYRKHFDSVCHRENGRQASIRDQLFDETARRRGITLPAPAGPPPRQTRAQVHRLWGWWALNEGHLPTARSHALAALQRAPWSAQSWRLIYCALRGR